MPIEPRDAAEPQVEPRDAAEPKGNASSPARPTRGHPLAVGAGVTIAVTVASYAAPADYAATAVGAVFLAAVTVLVWRHDVGTIRHFGLSLGGLLEPNVIDWRRVVREALRAAAWAGGLAALVTVPFAIGFRIYWHARAPFVFRPPTSVLDEVFGQALVIAIPEEGFYRGYLLTALDDLWGTPWTLFRAKLGWGWLVSSAIFAVGHFLTEPDPQRLAVFFPALVFGWLRARTGGVGAPALFHVLCNLLASTLSRGYGFGMS
jgi:membrane protease YdiL (CAAX protease family)